MRRMVIMVILCLLALAVPALAEQKLVNITEDTIPDNSYRPVAGKEFLVAVKLVDVDVNNQEQPVSNETVQFQTSAGMISEAEVISNIYGEAITWLTTSATADITHSITASVKNKPEINQITIEVKNIALPQDAPTAEELTIHVQTEVSKIQDMIAEVDITTNEPGRPPVQKLKVWEKGDRLKVQEIFPNSGIYVRPAFFPPAQIPQIERQIIAYNPVGKIYVISSKEESQADRLPLHLDYIDAASNVIIWNKVFLQEIGNINIISREFKQYTQVNNIWITKETIDAKYQCISTKQYEKRSLKSNININTGISDSEFN